MYNYNGFTDFNPTLGDLVKGGYPLFDDSWDTFVPEHKKDLCSTIVDYYYFNQIGADTPDKFRHFLNAQMRLKMPYYNQMYESTLLKINPLVNYAMKTQGRKIENLVKLANENKSSIGKAIRNFANSGNTNTDFNGNTIGKVGKIASQDRTLESVKFGEQDETGNLDKTVDTTNNKERDLTSKDVVESTLNRKQDVTANRTAEQTDATSGTESVDTTRNITGSKQETNLYSDTPQEQVNAEGPKSVRWDYLTNARNISSSENEDETTNTEREYSENKTQNITDNTTTNTTEESTANTTDNLMENETVDETGKETTDQSTTGHKDWKEQQNDTEGVKQNEDTSTTEDVTNKQRQVHFENGSDTNENSRADVAENKETSTKDEGNNEYTEGFMNITPADLIRAFRETFINVDEMIIQDLRGLFMEVF